MSFTPLTQGWDENIRIPDVIASGVLGPESEYELLQPLEECAYVTFFSVMLQTDGPGGFAINLTPFGLAEVALFLAQSQTSPAFPTYQAIWPGVLWPIKPGDVLRVGNNPLGTGATYSNLWFFLTGFRTGQP